MLKQRLSSCRIWKALIWPLSQIQYSWLVLAISADSFESMRSQPDSDPYAELLELLPLLVDSVSAYDPQDEPTQTYSVHLTEAGTPDFATTLEDTSPSHSVSWLF